jgi:hypothetical protein
MRYEVEFLLNGDFLIDEIEYSFEDVRDEFTKLNAIAYEILKEKYQTNDIEILCAEKAI